MVLKNLKGVIKPCQNTKKLIEHESDADYNYNFALRTIPNVLLRGLAELEIGEQAVTIETPAILRLAEISRGVLET